MTMKKNKNNNNNNKKKNTTKHILQRTCVACREVKAKRELIHLVRLASGGIEVDTDGRKAGRGAYLCPTLKCWRSGLAGDRLEYALRTSLGHQNREWLTEFAQSLDRELVNG